MKHQHSTSTRGFDRGESLCVGAERHKAPGFSSTFSESAATEFRCHKGMSPSCLQTVGIKNRTIKLNFLSHLFCNNIVGRAHYKVPLSVRINNKNITNPDSRPMKSMHEVVVWTHEEHLQSLVWAACGWLVLILNVTSKVMTDWGIQPIQDSGSSGWLWGLWIMKILHLLASL